MLQTLSGMRTRLDEAVGRRIATARQRLDAAAAHSALRRPVSRIREREERLDELGARLQRAIKLKTARAAEALTAIAGRLETLQPLERAASWLYSYPHGR